MELCWAELKLHPLVVSRERLECHDRLEVSLPQQVVIADAKYWQIQDLGLHMFCLLSIQQIMWRAFLAQPGTGCQI